MALQGPFFGKREPGEPRDANPRPQPLRPAAGASALSPAGSGAPAFSAPAAAGSTATTAASRPPPAANAAQLTVGRNIKLKGVEITDCDTLVVEGQVEATVKSRLVQISEEGSFKGSVQVDLAEVRGAFDGDLTVNDRLVIYASGRVSGKIRYGKIVIEEGGQLSGEVASRASDGAAAAGGAASPAATAAAGAGAAASA